MKYLPMLIFLTIVLFVFFGIHYYVFRRTLGFFGILESVWLIALILSALFPLATFLDNALHSHLTRIFYITSAVWVGFVFLMLSTLLLFEIVNIFYPIFHKVMFGWGIIIFVAALTVFSIINASNVIVKETSIGGFGKNITAVQLSDLHIGTVRDKTFLNNVVDKTNSLNPDVVFITGDLADGSGKLTKADFSPLKKIKVPVYFIMGNHDQYEGESSVTHLLEGTNVIILNDRMENFKGIQIIGLDYTENKAAIESKLSSMKINSSKPSILLNHAPVGYVEAQKAGITLQLSGHTHAGQIFPFTLGAKLVHPKDKGLYKMGDFSLYVSQGTGTWGPPMRLGTEAEITLLHLLK
jgi:uncharacterized protein